MVHNRLTNFAPAPGTDSVFAPPKSPPRITPGACLAPAAIPQDSVLPMPGGATFEVDLELLFEAAQHRLRQ